MTNPACPKCGVPAVVGDMFCEDCGHRLDAPASRDHVEDDGCAAAVTDRGVRKRGNEDAFAIGCATGPNGDRSVVAAVCDGVSTTARSADAALVAARTAVDALVTAVAEGQRGASAARRAAINARSAVAALGNGSAEPPSCTYVSALVTEETITIGWVGDSRAYWLGDPPARLTEDDSWAAMQVAAGAMTEAEAQRDPRAHAITRWFGADGDTEPPGVVEFTPDGPGTMLLCTDGLWNYFPSPAELAAAAETAAAAAGAAAVGAAAVGAGLDTARTLVELANAAGGHDNITVALIPFPPHHGEHTT